MKKTIIITILLLLICSSSKANSTIKKPNSLGNLITVIQINHNDTIGTKAFADKLLKGLAKVSDDDLTFACMDSLVSNNTKTRDFYWQVFQIILIKSDGALSEVVGSYLIAYLEKYPEEFINRYYKLGKNLKSKCVSFAAYEYYYMEDENVTEIQVRARSCKNCKSKENSGMEKFVKEVLIEIADIINLLIK